MGNRVTIDTSLCRGCALCTRACPKKIVRLDRGRRNERGCHPATLVDTEKCIACAACAFICPGSAITLEAGDLPRRE